MFRVTSSQPATAAHQLMPFPRLFPTRNLFTLTPEKCLDSLKETSFPITSGKGTLSGYF